MNESLCLTVLRLWVNQAWCDALSKIEAEALKMLIDQAPMLTDAERATARGLLPKAPPSAIGALTELRFAALDLRLRGDIYLVAYYLTMLDGKPNREESEQLLRLQRGLRLPDKVVQELHALFL